MATATLDIVEGSQIELSGQTGGRIRRTGIVTGLPTTGEPADALYQATIADGMKRRGSNHPTIPNMILATIGVFGLSTNKARVELIYEPFGSAIGTSYVLEVGSSLGTYETNMLPGSKDLIQVEHAGDGTTDLKIPPGLVTMTMLRPMVRVVVTQLRAGSLDVATCAAFTDNVGLVNNSTWLGKPPGTWIVSAATASSSRYEGYWQTRIESLRMSSDTWSYFGVLQSQETGKYAGGPFLGAAKDILIARPYASNSVETTEVFDGTGSVKQGIVKVNPYFDRDFATLFGFS